jgi:NADH:ubiquinone oxidoreductase subunit F (NADH-binding)
VVTAKEIEPLTLDNRRRSRGLMGSKLIVFAEGTCMVRVLQVPLRSTTTSPAGNARPVARAWAGSSHHRSHVAGEGRSEDIDRLYRLSAQTARRSWMGRCRRLPMSGILNKFRDEFEYFIEQTSRCNGTLECPRP